MAETYIVTSRPAMTAAFSAFRISNPAKTLPPGELMYTSTGPDEPIALITVSVPV
ncbi:MAG: hypothetical protein BWY66_00079 [bacterium ADurb.Bin374]|nr:MAG: hypothetical protein BWY66_00079 [bacterium ADurb.Bin374]